MAALDTQMEQLKHMVSKLEDRLATAEHSVDNLVLTGQNVRPPGNPSFRSSQTIGHPHAISRSDSFREAQAMHDELAQGIANLKVTIGEWTFEAKSLTDHREGERQGGLPGQKVDGGEGGVRIGPMDEHDADDEMTADNFEGFDIQQYADVEMMVDESEEFDIQQAVEVSVQAVNHRSAGH